MYELTFCLWTLSFGGRDVLRDFTTAGTVLALCDQVTAAPREKVVRVSLAALRNLAEKQADDDDDDGHGRRVRVRPRVVVARRRGRRRR